MEESGKLEIFTKKEKKKAFYSVGAIKTLKT
jgi:hypothetical protein